MSNDHTPEWVTPRQIRRDDNKPPSLDNPYFDAVRDAIGSAVIPPGSRDVSFNPLFDALKSQRRREYVERFAWAIPDDATVYSVATKTPLVEMGAGTGYWAWLLAQAGATVYAFDRAHQSVQNGYHRPDCSYFDVQFGLPDVLCDPLFHHCTLLLCWPPYDEPMAYDALKAFCGTFVVYIGEGEGGCTGDERFHEELRTRWTLIHTRDLYRWWGLNDRLYYYGRNR